MKGLNRKKELILDHERYFAKLIASAVVEKPKINLWMILLPILFMHFIYRSQKYKAGRLRFEEEFMVTCSRAIELAIEALESDTRPDINKVVRQYGLRDSLEEPYAAWLRTLFEYYLDLLKAEGDSFDQLVHSAYRNRSNYLLILNRLNTSEKNFYTELRSNMSGMEGTDDIITRIETQSRQLRRQLAEKMFA